VPAEPPVAEPPFPPVAPASAGSVPPDPSLPHPTAAASVATHAPRVSDFRSESSILRFQAIERAHQRKTISSTSPVVFEEYTLKSKRLTDVPVP